MRKNVYSDSEHTRSNTPIVGEVAAAHGGLPSRLLTAFEVAAFVGCHEETVRRVDMSASRCALIVVISEVVSARSLPGPVSSVTIRSATFSVTLGNEERAHLR